MVERLIERDKSAILFLSPLIILTTSGSLPSRHRISLLRLLRRVHYLLDDVKWPSLLLWSSCLGSLLSRWFRRRLLCLRLRSTVLPAIVIVAKLGLLVALLWKA